MNPGLQPGPGKKIHIRTPCTPGTDQDDVHASVPFDRLHLPGLFLLVLFLEWIECSASKLVDRIHVTTNTTVFNSMFTCGGQRRCVCGIQTKPCHSNNCGPRVSDMCSKMHSDQHRGQTLPPSFGRHVSVGFQWNAPPQQHSIVVLFLGYPKIVWEDHGQLARV